MKNLCSLPPKFNFVVLKNAAEPIFDMYTMYKNNNLLTCGENCKYADLVENAEEEEGSFLTSLASLNVGDAEKSQSALIENFAQISSDELTYVFVQYRCLHHS